MMSDDELKNLYRFSEFGIAMLYDRYLTKNETPSDLLKRVSNAYSENKEHSERILSYIQKCWFMPATPILSNGGTTRGLPISCFLNECDDSFLSIANLWHENAFLASKGGGIGSYWGNVRSIGESIASNGSSSGIIPFIKVMDSMTLAISQGSLRRGSAAIYLPISHPEIEEFIDIRRPTGDQNRKSLNIHHAVVITDEFMNAVQDDLSWNLKSPKNGTITSTLKARSLWIKILTTRVETGEPYILFQDNIKKFAPETYKYFNLDQKTSNLCSEITLTTGKDHVNKERTAVCCLSSLNLEYFDEWKNDEKIIEDIMLFLDNVLEDFIKKAPNEMSRAKYSATRERSVGLGVMGFHSYLQRNMIPLESIAAKGFNKKVFAHIANKVKNASLNISNIKGPCLDSFQMHVEKMIDENLISLNKKDFQENHEEIYVNYCNFLQNSSTIYNELFEKIKNNLFNKAERFTHKTAIAPTASISEICGSASPGIEPNIANTFIKKNLSGSYAVRSKYLKYLLIKKHKDTEEIWQSIVANNGSVLHLDFLDEHEKNVFKTAFEVDQCSLIELAADRTPFICQAQSLNLFLPSDIDKKILHKIHLLAWKLGLKSLYYQRSFSIGRGEKINQMSLQIEKSLKKLEDEECLACQ